MHRLRGIAIDWIERPQGSLGRGELDRLAARLGDIPSQTRTILIDWARVTHLDFRGVSRFASLLRALRGRGIVVFCDGIDPYLLTILRFSLSEEEFELFAQCAAGYGQPSAEARDVWTERYVPHFPAYGFSKN